MTIGTASWAPVLLVNPLAAVEQATEHRLAKKGHTKQKPCGHVTLNTRLGNVTIEAEGLHMWYGRMSSGQFPLRHTVTAWICKGKLPVL